MSKKENKTFSERVKLWVANKALRIAESMLAVERPKHMNPNPPKEPTIEPVKPEPIPQQIVSVKKKKKKPTTNKTGLAIMITLCLNYVGQHLTLNHLLKKQENV